VRGVTYGTFRPDGDGLPFPDPIAVETDFSRMRENGINAVRTYSVPPRWFLDLAADHGLLVMVGLPWEQHVAFLEDRARRNSIERRVREGVAACAGHPAVLAYALGNEISASIVRWYGRQRVERFLERLQRAGRAEDPQGLFTYVNFPSTEYLQLPFLDLVTFNVYLEQEEKLEAYAARLQNIAGDRPLVLAELGLDSRRNGEEKQAASLEWQLRTAFSAGSAGAFVFAWTDEWNRGGHDVEDWDFGLVDREREPKLALAAVRGAFEETPLAADLALPRVTVCVCTHNGAATLRDCLEGIAQLDYPDYEVIVVNDGSTDETEAIAGQFDVRVIRDAARGLSNARNLGLAAATGEIVAYLDDDARPDPYWLRYLAAAFAATPHVAIGGPNIAPPGAGLVAECVDKTPGGPIHVLLTDREAEHIPGCNMAFRKDALRAIGGFDPQFRVAGDDVDVCWRLQERGGTLGFSPAAMVWHHRRGSIRAHWRQQRGYGRAEAMLARKWPEKYKGGGHPRWAGRVYHSAAGRPRRWRIYYGTWGTGLFQSAHAQGPGLLSPLLLLPQWYALAAVLAGMSAFDFLDKPPVLRAPDLGLPLSFLLLALCLTVPVVQAGHSAWRALAPLAVRRRRLQLWPLTALLHLIQPLARLVGRLRYGPNLWRSSGRPAVVRPWPRTRAVWCEEWRSATQRLRTLEEELRAHGVEVLRGGDFDRWDIQVGVSGLGGARLRMAVEEHGSGRQLLRFRIWPRWSSRGAVALLALGALFGLAVYDGAGSFAAILGVLGFACAAWMVRDCSAGLGAGFAAVERLGEQEAARQLVAIPSPANADRLGLEEAC
jgi:GT2 family glycosyltransferase